jgi:hypothetical protein
LIAPQIKKTTYRWFLFVGMRGFEPPISGPPDQHFNRTKLHPEFYLKR